MKDTGQLRARLLKLWAQFDKGEIDATEARTHIEFARATLDTIKVEIAASHLSAAQIPPVPLVEPINGTINGRARRLSA